MKKARVDIVLRTILSPVCLLVVHLTKSMTHAAWPLPLANFPHFSHHQPHHNGFHVPNLWSGLRMSPSNAIPYQQYVRPLEVPMSFPIASLGHYTPIGIELPPDEEYMMSQRHARRRHKNRNHPYHNRHNKYQDERQQNNGQEEVPRPATDGMESGRDSSKTDQFTASGTNNEVLEIDKKNSDQDTSNDENYQLFQKLSNAVRDDKSSNKLTNNNNHIETMPPDPPKKPVGIRKKTVASPNGQVTYITEMLYDVEDHSQPFNRVTRPPSSMPPSPYIPPSTDVLMPPTDDPIRSTHPYSYPISVRESSGLRKASTTESATEWPGLPTPPTNYQTLSGLRDRSGNFKDSTKNDKLASLVQASGSDRRESNLFNDDHHVGSSFNTQPMANLPVNKHPTTRPMFGLRSSSRMFEGSKTWKESKEGLGAAAIAGIVIGSLVSITLLAGMMYSNIFFKYFLVSLILLFRMTNCVSSSLNRNCSVRDVSKSFQE